MEVGSTTNGNTGVPEGSTGREYREYRVPGTDTTTMSMYCHRSIGRSVSTLPSTRPDIRMESMLGTGTQSDQN